MANLAMVLAGGFGPASTIMQAQAQKHAAKAQKASLDFEASQLEDRADQEFAAGQREAGELRKRKELALSTLQASSAASGFSATDATTLDLAGDIEERGSIQERSALFSGSQRAAGLETQATARRATGNAAVQGGRFASIGTILSGVSSMGRFAAQMRGRHAPVGAGATRYG